MRSRRSSRTTFPIGAPWPEDAIDAPAAPPAPLQSRLDALFTHIAVELMSASAASLSESLESTLRALTDFFGVDASFLRRNDLPRGLSVMVAEWPRRENVPDPDPLGEVPFEADPVFGATMDLKQPVVLRPQDSPDSYQDRVEQGTGISGVSIAIVPLIRIDSTVGVLGFVKLGDRQWEDAETNALQAVASLMVHLLARVEAEERLRVQAYHDELTDLPNRRSFLRALQERLDRTAGQTVGVFLVHVDRFKAVNDSLGYRMGDELLRVMGERLREAAADGDCVARLGGAQFAILVERSELEFDAEAMAERISALVTRPVEMGGTLVSRTASVGISSSSGQSTTADALLTHAGAALHRSKARGGNRSVVFDEALQDSVFNIELQLREAIHEGGLLLYYQPEVDLRTGELLAVEALVRWNHPQRGVLAAAEFITVAEEAGLVTELGRWVLAEACRQMAQWRVDYPLLNFTMRVNLSPAQLATRDIVRLVESTLEENGLPGQTLCLEITEHAIVQDVEQATKVLYDLRALGVSLAIDDFGTGYSSMSQLKRLPVDILKIDQTFVAGLGIDGRDRAIVDATIRLAHSFGLEVVAEGVETRELVHELLSLGCSRAQGYQLCRPKPALELTQLLRSGGIDPATFSPATPVFAPR
jgi:diguanylate cyclase (GGDEF)-like protein